MTFNGTTKHDKVEAIFYIAVCGTCDRVLIYEDMGDIDREESFESAGLVWPNPGVLGHEVPRAVAEVYQEAARIILLAPNAFAVQIRRALEAICKDRGAKGRVLAKQLQDLAARGEIPPTLVEVSDVMRLIGNIGAHLSDEPVKPWQARMLNDFFLTLVEYVYVAPHKLKTFKEVAETYSKTDDAA